MNSDDILEQMVLGVSCLENISDGKVNIREGLHMDEGDIEIMASQIEDLFTITIDEDVIEDWTTISDVVSSVREILEKNPRHAGGDKDSAYSSASGAGEFRTDKKRRGRPKKAGV